MDAALFLRTPGYNEYNDSSENKYVGDKTFTTFRNI